MRMCASLYVMIYICAMYINVLIVMLCVHTIRVGIWEHKLIYHNDIRLPYCGHTQYLTKVGNLGVEQNYTEGTIDNRILQGRLIRFDICNDFIQWGLPEVYSSKVSGDD